MRLGLRLVLLFMLVALIPDVLMLAGGLSEFIKLNQSLMDTATKETAIILEDVIKHRAKEIASKIEFFMKNYSGPTNIEYLRKDPGLRNIAIQRVFKTGYTAVEAPDGLVLFHPDPTIEGHNMLTDPPRKLDPNFVKLYEKALSSTTTSGYYNWTERDGTVKRKFLATYRVPQTKWIVHATAYIEELYQPILNAQEITNEQVEIIRGRLVIYGIFAALLATLVGTIVSISIVIPVKRMRRGIAAFSKGDYSYRIPIKGTGQEINALAALLNQFAEQLETTTRDLKKETAKLIDSEARYRALVENTNQPLMLVDNQAAITYINPAFIKTLGYSDEEVIGKKFDDFAHPDDTLALRRRAGYAIARNRKGFQMLVRAKHKNGYFLIVDINAALVYSRNQRWLYTVVVGQDVTKTYNLQQELQTAELILNQAESSIALFGADGRTEFANKRWANTHGFFSEQVCQNMHWSEFFSEKSSEDIERCLITALNGTSVSIELPHRRSDKSETYALTTFSPFINPSGQPVGVICSASDITEYHQKLATSKRRIATLEQSIKRLDIELESALEKVRAVDKLKADFLASMSHELRTPLNAIMGFSKFLLDNISPIPEEYRTDIALIYQNSLYLYELFSSTMEMKEVDSGDVALDMSEFSLSELVGEVLHFIKRVYSTDHLQFKNRLAQDDIKIFADRGKIRRVLFGLISNAVKFTHKGEVVISAHQDDDKITVEVMDTGIGIPPSEKERIYERFVQLQAPAPSQFKGSGLGLSLAKAYVEMHGGVIDFRPNPQEGVTFWFTIPNKKSKSS